MVKKKLTGESLNIGMIYRFKFITIILSKEQRVLNTNDTYFFFFLNLYRVLFLFFKTGNLTLHSNSVG